MDFATPPVRKDLMSEELKTKTRNYMKSLLPFLDGCNETDHTGLAEEAADELDLYENDGHFTIPEWVFEMAGEY